MQRRSLDFRSILTAVAVLSASLSAGCVERYLRVDTVPDGVSVYVDGKYVGETPLKHSFIHYGTVRLDLQRRGYRPRTDYVPLRRPWYQWFPFDILSETFDPRHHVDRHEVGFEMSERGTGVEPTALDRVRTPAADLLENAESLRARVQ